MFDSSLSYVLNEGLTRRFAPRPAGALRASVGAARLGSNPRRAFNPYSLSRGARWLGANAPRPSGAVASLQRPKLLTAILSTTQPSLRIRG